MRAIHVTIRSIGNSKGVVLPKPVLAQVGLEDATDAEMTVENGVIQHMADIEAIHTYEGTESVQALLLGRDITGMSAFA